MFLLTGPMVFPAVQMADEDGLLAIGGDLSTERLLLAYRQGIFPWYNEGELIQWWCPDPRFVLYPGELKVSKSMKQVLGKKEFTFTINKAFEAVIANCKTITREGQAGTWIQDEVVEAYTALHKKGIAISAEAWKKKELVGGLYGIRLGNIFFGESMFSKQSNASKFAFIKLVQQLQAENVQLIDCQVYTQHLESLGARMISRELFGKILEQEIV
jgi:leucyl/phenylalanyl-tRNA---protein transferase